jgi:hypothetical protein
MGWFRKRPATEQGALEQIRTLNPQPSSPLPKRGPTNRPDFVMKTAFVICLCALLLGCSQRQQYGIRVLNRSTNDLSLFTVSWDGAEVIVPCVASVSASYGQAYGAPSSDVTVYPRAPRPTTKVLISYLTPGPVTNTSWVVLSKGVLQAVRDGHSNFMFMVNRDATITSAVSAEPK